MCKLCDKNQIENEAHFLFDCDLYTNHRTDKLASLNADFDQMNELQKLELVFKHPFALGIYVKSYKYSKSKIVQLIFTPFC